MSGRTAARGTGLALAMVASFLAATVWATGGVGLSVGGLGFTAHDPTRAMVVALVGWTLFLAAGGQVRWPVSWSPVTTRRVQDALAVTLALATGAAAVVWSTTAAGGSDSYGYVSQAELWLHGTPVVAQPWVDGSPWPNANWTFTPLGYTPVVRPDGVSAFVPTYAPGLPWMLALAKAAAGQEGLFWVTPICVVILVAGTYSVGRHLASPSAGLAAAWLVATSPIVLYMMVAPMSDVPVAAAWTMAFALLLSPRVWRAFASGLVAALAIAIRPNLVFGAGILAAWCVWRWMRAQGAERAVARQRGLACASGLVPGVVAVAAVNATMYGSPLRSGYGTTASLFSSEYFWPNVWTYGGWIVETGSPILLGGLVALLLPLRRLWPAAPDRAALVTAAAFTASVWVAYCFYFQFEAWWYLRFLLPTWPFMTLGLTALLCAAGGAWPATRVLAILVLLVLGASGVREASSRGTFGLWMHERRYPSVARSIRELTGERSVIVAQQHSGSLRYYAGRLTLRADILDPDWLDRAVAWLDARGIRTYLLIDEDEAAMIRERFRGQQTLARLDQPPRLRYQGTTRVMLYALSDEPATDSPPTVHVDETYRHLRSVAPMPLALPGF